MEKGGQAHGNRRISRGHPEGISLGARGPAGPWVLLAVACTGGESGSEGPSEGTGSAEQPGAGTEQPSSDETTTPGNGDSGEDEGQARQYGIDENYDQVHAGVRFTIDHEPGGPIFIGWAENTTDKHLWDVRVGIKLSNGWELGPTPPRFIGPGGSSQVYLEDTSPDPWTTWSVYAEVDGTTFPVESGTGIEQPEADETVSPGKDDTGDDEEPVRQYKSHETYDEVRNGVRLVLAYSETGIRSFFGRAENTTDYTLANVRVVVRTSGGTTLITTPLRDLTPGEIMRVELGSDPFVLDPFGTWTAYPEVDVDPVVAEAQDWGSWELGPKAPDSRLRRAAGHTLGPVQFSRGGSLGGMPIHIRSGG